MMLATALAALCICKVYRPPTPPRGWNSFDWGNGTNVYSTPNVKEIMDQSSGMAKFLLPHGYEYFIIGGGWYDGSSRQSVDQYGRPVPNPVTYPELNGNWSTISAHLHGVGLKFGIWETVGLPQAAFDNKLPIKGTNYTADEIVERGGNGQPLRACSWIPDQWRLNLSHPGSASYYQSMVDQFEEWEVDYVVMDCAFGPNFAPGDIKLWYSVVDRSPRDIVWLLSPGPSSMDKMLFAKKYSSMARIQSDFYANWHQTFAHFAPAAEYAPISGAENGFYQFLDKLPFGKMRGQKDNSWPWWNTAGMYSVMTFWSVVQSPLIFGGDMRENSSCTGSPTPCGIRQSTIDFIGNDRVLDVNNDIRQPRQLYDSGFTMVYVGNSAATSSKRYVAVFNIFCSVPRQPDPPCKVNATMTTQVSFQMLGLPLTNTYRVFNLWENYVIGDYNTSSGNLTFSVTTAPINATLVSVTAV